MSSPSSRQEGRPLPVVVLGSGRIGRLVVRLLADCGDYIVTAVDGNEEVAQRAALDGDGRPLPGVTAATADFANTEQLQALLEGQAYVVSCAPYWCNTTIARIAGELGVHYLDLTEDVRTTKAIMQMAEEGKVAYMPQSGLAPGFIQIVAAHLAKDFERLDEVKMRVGALPLFPHNRLKYNLTWSTDGLINEYGNPCEAIVDGEATWVQPLHGHETFSIDGVDYEAFNTSGGLGTLAETLAGEVRTLNYKTIRYPGHRDAMAMLMFDFKLNDDRDTLKAILERALPHTHQDVVVVFVTVTGWRNGEYAQEAVARKIYHRHMGGSNWGAIQVTTASGVCAVLDLHAAGRLPQAGFIRQEDVAYEDFINNRFGKNLAANTVVEAS
jgi:saccharopine dehydrogenase-like NADP-dependent oxidoreductase